MSKPTKEERKAILDKMTVLQLCKIMLRKNPFGGYSTAQFLGRKHQLIDTILRYEDYKP
jgi:hypothetical protein